MQYRPEFEAALRVCPTCNYRDRMDAAERIALLLDDPKSFVEIDAETGWEIWRTATVFITIGLEPP